ncbi:hypothetical protein [Flavobacterium sp. 3HN19-14]|uniref:hypothetical protein n=1 Tax=Flavobacterium sp. 3HN19-14 TaxID=3448133 RepID=UPI003EE1819C
MTSDKYGNIAKIKTEIANLDKLIGKEGISKERTQQDILAFVSANSDKIAVNDLKAVHEFNDENYRIFTFQLDLTGDFNSLQQLAYNFEKKFTSSKIAGMNFYTEKKNNQAEVLHLKIIFQNYENNK